MNAQPLIWVTGASGQLGRELQDIADQYPDYRFHFTSKEDLSLTDADAVKKFFTSNKPSYCINAGAYTAVDKAESPGEKEKAFEINGEAVGQLARCCKEFQCKLVHVSTDYVFNGRGEAPYAEDDKVDPVNAYGASKLKGEELALEHTDAIVVRTSWVYSVYGKNFVKTMLILMRTKSEISVVNDQFGSPTYAADLASAILSIITSGIWVKGIYHYSNEGVITWYDFAVAIKEISGSTTKVNPILTKDFPTPAKRPAWSVLDKSKITDLYQLKLNDWRESLALCITRLNGTNF